MLHLLSNFQHLVFSAHQEISGTELYTHTHKHTDMTTTVGGAPEA